jgi:hypothetical protein
VKDWPNFQVTFQMAKGLVDRRQIFIISRSFASIRGSIH